VTYVLYGAALAFTWFLALHVSLSLVVAALSPRVSSGIAECAPEMRARILLALRLLPAAASIVFVICVFVPSFWTLEPRDFDEAFGITTTTFAAAAVALLVTAACRGASALREAAERSRAWLEHATPMALAGAPAPAYCLDTRIAAMTLVGVIRPKLLVTRRLIEALTAEELRAAVEHEAGHLSSWDNLKRLAMRATPDALSLLLATNRRLEHGWALAAEQAADARAARDSNAGLALASALVKVARMTPVDAPPRLPGRGLRGDRPLGALASPLIGGDAIASRVERLMNGSPNRPLPRRRRLTCWMAGAGTLLALAAGYAPLLQAVHRISEVVVHALP
jgi:Zn-dependent protease with chaperone function